MKAENPNEDFFNDNLSEKRSHQKNSFYRHCKTGKLRNSDIKTLTKLEMFEVDSDEA